MGHGLANPGKVLGIGQTRGDPLRGPCPRRPGRRDQGVRRVRRASAETRIVASSNPLWKSPRWPPSPSSPVPTARGAVRPRRSSGLWSPPLRRSRSPGGG